MNVMMYPFGPDDDFPDEFCAIRQGSGEHWFYTPVGENESWTVYHALAENYKLRKLVDYMTPIAWYAASKRERDRMRELGVDA